jgi:hypothetical protein
VGLVDEFVEELLEAAARIIARCDDWLDPSTS